VVFATFFSPQLILPSPFASYLAILSLTLFATFVFPRG
jgi:hypothetical protein